MLALWAFLGPDHLGLSCILHGSAWASRFSVTVRGALWTPAGMITVCSKIVLSLPALPQTRITLNGGADWRALDPPASYRWPVCNTCKPGAPADQCRLHLHGPTSWFAPQGKRGAPLVRPGLPCLMTGNGMLLAFRCGLIPAEAAGPHPNFCSHQGRGSFCSHFLLLLP